MENLYHIGRDKINNEIYIIDDSVSSSHAQILIDENVDLIIRNHTGASSAWPPLKKIGIADRELNYPLRSMPTYTLMHEFQHCDPRDGSEGAACWATVTYGKQTGVHPCLIKFYKGVAIGPHGYSQAKWDAAHRK